MIYSFIYDQSVQITYILNYDKCYLFTIQSFRHWKFIKFDIRYIAIPQLTNEKLTDNLEPQIKLYDVDKLRFA